MDATYIPTHVNIHTIKMQTFTIVESYKKYI